MTISRIDHQIFHTKKEDVPVLANERSEGIYFALFCPNLCCNAVWLESDARFDVEVVADWAAMRMAHGSILPWGGTKSITLSLCPYKQKCWTTKFRRMYVQQNKAEECQPSPFDAQSGKHHRDAPSEIRPRREKGGTKSDLFSKPPPKMWANNNGQQQGQHQQRTDHK